MDSNLASYYSFLRLKFGFILFINLLFIIIIELLELTADMSIFLKNLMHLDRQILLFIHCGDLTQE